MRGRLPSPVSRCLANFPRRQGRMTFETHGSTRVQTLADSGRFSCRYCWTVTRIGASQRKGWLCQVTPGAPISVQRRGGRYRAFTIACTGADVVAGVRARGGHCSRNLSGPGHDR